MFILVLSLLVTYVIYNVSDITAYTNKLCMLFSQLIHWSIFHFYHKWKLTHWRLVIQPFNIRLTMVCLYCVSCVAFITRTTALHLHHKPSMHYSDIIMTAMVSQITSLTIVYSTVYSGADKRKYQSSASLAFVPGIQRWPVNSSHKWPVTRKNVSIWWRHHGWACFY